MGKFVVKNGKELATGYTTGTCACALAVGGAYGLLTGEIPKIAQVTLPAGEVAELELFDVFCTNEEINLSTKKNAGDDPDITHGMTMSANVKKIAKGIVIKGGKGVGIVTCDGLKSPKGDWAINPVPREMIKNNLERVCQKYNYTGGIEIIITIPEGEKLAKKTFNPRLGIEGGLSILGTTGIVEPMSEKALVDSIYLDINRSYSRNEEILLISPGNYARDYCTRELDLNVDEAVKFANYLGETLDYIAYKGFKKVLLIGHSGKLVKVAGGIMNTHSKMADCRMEILALNAILAGGSVELAEAILQEKTTAGVEILLDESELSKAVWQRIGERVQFQLDYRLGEDVKIEFIIFGEAKEPVYISTGARDFIAELKGK